MYCVNFPPAHGRASDTPDNVKAKIPDKEGDIVSPEGIQILVMRITQAAARRLGMRMWWK